MGRGNRSTGSRAFPAAGARRGGMGRLVIGLVVAGIALLSYCSSSEFNPVTGEKQYVSLTPKQEIALGLQALPEMMAQHGGAHADESLQAVVDRIGRQLVTASAARETGWQFDFHLLADPETVNAFALPGGQVFITYALFRQLESPAQLAGILGHEIGHVVARHSAQRMAKADLTQGLLGAVVVASESASSAQVAAVVGQMVNMKFGRDDELESDRLGVVFMSNAGYDPRAMIGVMEILARAGGGARQPEFFSTHPNPDNRIMQIRQAIDEIFPDGVPPGLED